MLQKIKYRKKGRKSTMKNIKIYNSIISVFLISIILISTLLILRPQSHANQGFQPILASIEIESSFAHGNYHLRYGGQLPNILQFWSDSWGDWETYIAVSHVYHYENGRRMPAYCIQPELPRRTEEIMDLANIQFQLQKW